MVSVRSLTSLRSSASKSRTGSAGVRSTGSPKRRIGLTLTKTLLDTLRRPPVHRGAASLARASGGLGGVQGACERETVPPADPDQRSAFPRGGDPPGVPPDPGGTHPPRPPLDRNRPQHLGLRG